MNASASTSPAKQSWTAYQDHRGAWYVRRSDGQFLAAMSTGHEFDRDNACLMAAAHDMLQALEILNEWSITAPVEDFPYPVVEAAIRNARAG
jgi:hypothetical protein